ncbi:MAG: PAS domain-containing protein [Bacteroidota bacterium]
MTTKQRNYNLIKNSIIYATIVIGFTALILKDVPDLIGGMLIASMGFLLLTILNEQEKQANEVIEELENRDNPTPTLHAVVVNKQHNMTIMAEATPEGTAYLDPTHRLLHCNPAFAKWFGRQGQNLQGTHLVEILGTLNYTAYELLLDEIRIKQEKLTFEEEFTLQNDEKKMASVTITPILENEYELQSFLLTIKDITAAKKPSWEKGKLAYLPGTLDLMN